MNPQQFFENEINYLVKKGHKKEDLTLKYNKEDETHSIYAKNNEIRKYHYSGAILSDDQVARIVPQFIRWDIA